jgi:hypothetical protein
MGSSGFELDIALEVVSHSARDEDSSDRGQCLKAGRDVDPVTDKVGPIDDHIA